MDLLSSFTQKSKLKESVKKIIEKYPDRVPVYVTRGKGDKHLKNIDQNKFIVPEDITVAQFMTIIRKKVELTPEMALFLFVNKGTLPVQSSTMAALYNKYKNNDGLLEIEYCGENTFGFN
jgi:GABA(A) receptor-associated protein